MLHFHEIHYTRNKSRYILPLYPQENEQAKMKNKQKKFIRKKKNSKQSSVKILTVMMSPAYIANGSSIFSPVNMTSNRVIH